MQINNATSPNFGMALKIKASKDSLAKLPMAELEKIEKCGNELKDTKFYNLVLNKDLKPSIESPFANGYAEYFIAESPRDQFLSVNTVWNGTEINNLKKGDKHLAVVEMLDNLTAKLAYNKMNTANSTLEKATEFVKILDDAHQFKVAKEQEAQKLHNERCAKADELLKNFGDNNVQ